MRQPTIQGVLILSVLFALVSCKQNKPVVPVAFVDSLIGNYQPSLMAKTVEQDLQFWKARFDKTPGNFVAAQKYAQALTSRFRIYGSIRDLIQADSLISSISRQYHEPGYLLTLASYNLLQHRFAAAKKYIDTVVSLKAERYATQMMLFDADFELGNEYNAINILKSNTDKNDYAYNFRQSKLDHLQGNADSAIAHMLKAARLAQANPYLQQVALSNAADLYVHTGELAKAFDLYQQCVRFNSNDVHSLAGIGWIALVHDHNRQLAVRIFNWINTHNEAPDALLKLAYAYEATDPAMAKKYAEQFVQKAAQPVYGAMYHKYIIDLYTGILQNPQAAIAIAENELEGRATPQTYSWLSWSYFCASEKDKAYEVYKAHVSGQPLEGPELYKMGKLMAGLNKGYNAQQFFEAAHTNRYDLSPAQQEDLKEQMNR